MTSQIGAIYDALAETVVVVGGRIVTVLDADEIPNSVPSANLPLRVLTPITDFGLEVGATSEAIPSSGGSTPYVVDWAVNDIMLWSKVVSDVGVKAHAKDLIDYSAQYLDMLKGLSIPANLTSVTLVPEILNYPIGSNDYFYGVRAVLTVKEKFL